ncbi:uncharacterized protein MYCGRDRAFT_79179, partial [Zymoseptoria tritici IPO323]
KKKKKRQSTLSYTRISSKSEPKSHLVHFKELEQSVESTTLRLTCVAVCVGSSIQFHKGILRTREDSELDSCFCTAFALLLHSNLQRVCEAEGSA